MKSVFKSIMSLGVANRSRNKSFGAYSALFGSYTIPPSSSNSFDNETNVVTYTRGQGYVGFSLPIQDIPLDKIEFEFTTKVAYQEIFLVEEDTFNIAMANHTLSAWNSAHTVGYGAPSWVISLVIDKVNNTITWDFNGGSSNKGDFWYRGTKPILPDINLFLMVGAMNSGGGVGEITINVDKDTFLYPK
ncbi:MAG: hypothetical protein IBX57_00570 [Gammaproteobacteria bacterium]|nr:hypothetical protein [Gammaproteobacteria bacterium]